MNGGNLVQHCSGHAIGYTHEITNGNESYDITSTHHQMQYPFEIPSEYYDLLYWCNPRGVIYEGDGIDVNEICTHGDSEIVYYHVPDKPKCLAIQGHPEMMRSNAPVIDMLNNLIDKILESK